MKSFDSLPEFQALAKVYGPPAVRNEQGHLSVNPTFFAAFLCTTKQLIYERDEGDFYHYNCLNGLWQRVTDARLLLETAQLMLEVAHKTKWDALIAKRTDGHAKGIISFAKGIAEQEKPFSKSKGKVIHLRSGMYSIRENTLLPHGPDWQSRNLIPIAYDPTATCPRFQNELLNGLAEDDLKLVQMWGGGVLLGVNLAQKILILCGVGGGGKSTLLLIISTLLGRDNIAQLRLEHLGNRFEAATYLDKLLLIGTDIRPSAFSEKFVGSLKSLTGGDLLDAECKGKDRRFQFRGDKNVGISCNGQPELRIEGDASAWQRRLLIVSFDGDPSTKRIQNFEQVLIAEEGPGILNFFVAGALELLKALRETGVFPMSQRQQSLVSDLIGKNDTVRAFVEEACEKRSGSITTSAELYDGYHAWCDAKNYECDLPEPKLRAALCDQIWAIHKISKRHDLRPKDNPRGKLIRGYKGLKIADRLLVSPTSERSEQCALAFKAITSNHYDFE